MSMEVQFSYKDAWRAGMRLEVDIDQFVDWRDESIPVYDMGYIIVSEGLPTTRAEVFIPLTPEECIKLEPTISVTANKWGSLYGPLTDWLRTNNIKWEEV